MYHLWIAAVQEGSQANMGEDILVRDHDNMMTNISKNHTTVITFFSQGKPE